MAIDTLVKRYSVIATLLPWRSTIPLPTPLDAKLTLSDRQILCGLYAGIRTRVTQHQIAIFGTFTFMSRINMLSMDIISRVVSPILLARAGVVFYAVTLQEKPLPPRIPVEKTLPRLVPTPAVIPAPTLPQVVLAASFVEMWETEQATAPLAASYTESWEGQSVALATSYVEHWDVTETILIPAYTELWEL